MRKRLPAILVLSLLACRSHSVQGWNEYVYAKAGFAVSLPLPPQVEQPVSNMTRYTVDLPDGKLVVIRTSNERPRSPEEAKADLGKLVDRITGNIGGDIVSAQDLALGSTPGRALLVRNGKLETAMRCYVARSNMYALMASGAPLPEEAGRFFQSFKILAQ